MDKNAANKRGTTSIVAAFIPATMITNAANLIMGLF